MTRKIRTKSKQKPTQTVSQKTKSRTVAQVHTEFEIAIGHEKLIKELANTLNDTEIGLLVDHSLGETEKASKWLDAVGWIKPLLKVSSLEQKWKKKSGDIAEAKVMAASSTSFTCTVTKFVAFLKKEGKLKLVDDLLSIKLGDVKKYLGEEALKGITKKATDPYGRFSIARKKGTK